MKTRLPLGLILGALLVPLAAGAQLSPNFAVQGVLRDDAGALVTGTHSITVNIYDKADLTGVLLRSETFSGVNVDTGLFTVYVGSGTPTGGSQALDVLLVANNELYIGVSLDAEAELVPRIQVSVVPYAFQAEHANFADLATDLADPTAYQRPLSASCGTGLMQGFTQNGTPACTPTCSDGQILKWNGTSGLWECQADVAGSYVAGAGIGISGSTISLATCTSGQILRHNGTSWACATDYVGDITDLTAGTGITITNGATANPTISINTAQTQARVTGSCTAGQAISAIAADGTVTCGLPRMGYTYLGSWSNTARIFELPGHGYAEATGTAGQIRIVNNGTATLMYNIQTCASCASEGGTVAAGSSVLSAASAGTYDQIKITLQYWNGPNTAVFIGTRAGSICSGFWMRNI